MFARLTGILRAAGHAMVRAASRLREAPAAIYERLRGIGVREPEPAFEDRVKAFRESEDLAPSLAVLHPDELVPGPLHVKSPDRLKSAFQYVVRIPWEDKLGVVHEQFHRRMSDVRLTTAEVFEAVEDEVFFYVPEDGVFHGDFELAEAWYGQAPA